MIMGKYVQLGAICLTALILATACEPGKRDLEQWVAETLRQPGGEIDPIPPIAAVETVAYAAYDLRDPFQRRVARPDDESGEGMAANGVRPDPDRGREFLESFPLDTLKMVGTLELDGVSFALVRDNENVVHRVSAGNYMGTNHGRVVSVGSNRVELIELYEDARGGWVERRSQIVMAEDG
jgi:type IV pilus assembly protein PilP